MKAPGAVRAQLRRGLRLWAEGRAGAGLRPETVAWARALAAGELVTPARLRAWRAWHRRHGASWREVAARERQLADLRAGQLRARAPALVAWLLWGGAAGERWGESARVDALLTPRRRRA